MDQRTHKLGVVIVDDNAAFRSAARKLLERRGYVVVGEADCCVSALELVGQLTPDAVLLDVFLPDGTGLSLSATLTAGDPAPAVLLMSSGADLSTYGLLESSGARGLVCKSELATTDLSRFWPDN